MAANNTKSRNSERRNGKAWSKNNTEKALTTESIARKAAKDARRAAKKSEKRAMGSSTRGSNYTMPKFTWEWATETMSGTRYASTRRFQMVGLCLAEERGRVSWEAPAATEANPEAKKSKSSRKNGK